MGPKTWASFHFALVWRLAASNVDAARLQRLRQRPPIAVDADADAVAVRADAVDGVVRAAIDGVVNACAVAVIAVVVVAAAWTFCVSYT